MYAFTSLNDVCACVCCWFSARPAIFNSLTHVESEQGKRWGRRGRVDSQTEVRETKIGSNKALKKQMNNRMQIICVSVCAHCLNFNTIKQKC